MNGLTNVWDSFGTPTKGVNLYCLVWRHCGFVITPGDVLLPKFRLHFRSDKSSTKSLLLKKIVNIILKVLNLSVEEAVTSVGCLSLVRYEKIIMGIDGRVIERGD